jgi:DamX protein
MANSLVDSENHDNAKPLETPFIPSSWLAKMSFINHLVLFNNVLMAVVAEKGGGKTTFMELLCSNLDVDIQSYSSTATKTFSLEEWCAGISNALNLPIAATQSSVLDNLIDSVNTREAHVLVMVDEAQNLPQSFLQSLLNLLKQSSNKNYFHVCLLGDFALVSSLNAFHRTEFKEFIHTIEPGSLSEMETKTYLLHRLAQKGVERKLHEQRVEQFYHVTAGNIARINAHLSNVLLPARGKSLSVGRVSLTLVLLLAVFVNVTYWWHEKKRLDYLENRVEHTKIMQAVDSLSTLAAPKRHVNKMPVLTSVILPYQVASLHLAVQPAPLRSILASIETDTLISEEDLVVMDKVVVIPKLQLARH